MNDKNTQNDDLVADASDYSKKGKEDVSKKSPSETNTSKIEELADAISKKGISSTVSAGEKSIDKQVSDDIVFDTSEFDNSSTKLRAGSSRKPQDEPSDVVSISDEDSQELSPEAFLKLKDKLKKALAEKQEYLDGWQRAKADFINFKKQTENERIEFIKFANEGFVEELLPTLDSFSMAFNNKEAWEKVDKNWRTGVEYIYNQLITALANNGLKELSPLGETFDPMRDEAIEYIPVDDEKNNHKIIVVVQKGYSLNGKIIKAPKVRVGEFKKS